MKRKSITFKLFIITSTFLFLLITMFMLAQTVFFEKFYYSQKTKHLMQSVTNFKENYKNNIFTNKQLYDYIYRFEDKNNAQMAFLNKNGVIKYIRNAVISSNTNENNEVIIMAVKNWVSYEQSYFDVIASKKTVTFNFINPILNTKNLVIVSPILINDQIQDIVFVVSTLQPIGEATSVIKTYYIYMYAGVLLIIILLSLIYSKMISKPLLELNLTASKIANLDFSAESKLTSNDEIGNLSRTLNFLSKKLSSTLFQLQTANKQLKKDIEKERQLEKMRKEFIAGVSHELKTPISLIEGYAEGLKDGVMDEDDKEYYLDVIIDESEKMGKLVTDMLDLSQLESGSFKLNLKEFNVLKHIYNIYKKYVTNDINRTFLFNSYIDDNTLVIGDEFRIEQVITNLITNAIRYSQDKGCISIILSEEANNVVVSIENEGIQIAEEELDLIWEKFYRVDKSRNKNSGGTGLGLSIVKNILELHESEYLIKNIETGVSFSFTLRKI